MSHHLHGSDATVVVGAGVGGLMGALMAVPIIATGRILAQYAYNKILDYPPFPDMVAEPAEPAPTPVAEPASRRAARRGFSALVFVALRVTICDYKVT